MTITTNRDGSIDEVLFKDEDSRTEIEDGV